MQHELTAVDEPETFEGEGEVLLLCLWDARELASGLRYALHDQMTAIAPEVLDNNRDGRQVWLEPKVIHVASSLGGAPVFACDMAVVSH